MILVTTKERLLQYLEYKGIGRSEFYAYMGIKRGLLDADKMKATISDPIIAKILVAYPDLDITWLLTGNGSMLKQNVSNDKNMDNTLVSSDKDTINNRTKQEETSYMYKMYQDEKSDWKEEKKELKEQINQLQSDLRQKSEELAALKAKYPEASIEHPEGLSHAKPASTKKHSSPPNADNATSATVP